nr:argonaute PAZ domain-containing protein [Cyanobacterium stanieri]
MEIDSHHRFYTPWTLQQWLEKYPDAPFKYMRNTYKIEGKYLSWILKDITDENPETMMIENTQTSLAQYHRERGATEKEIKNSQLILVKKANGFNNQLIPHLSSRVSPSLTMEMLAHVAENTDFEEKKEVQEVFQLIKKSFQQRIDESTFIANEIATKIYQVDDKNYKCEAIKVTGFKLPEAEILAKKGKVNKVSQVRQKGCAKVGELKLGCLNLYNDAHQYPAEVEKCLLDIARSSDVEINYQSYRNAQDFPHHDLERKMFWQKWADEGIKTVLVVLKERLGNTKKIEIRKSAFSAGIATQFIIAKPKANAYKATNVVLGLLCKAQWQTVHLKPSNYAQTADLIIGFDTGTNRQLYYGTPAYAILADGQSLGWELPDVQRGEAISGKVVWQIISNLVLKFYHKCDRYPHRILIMRDGLVQKEEFSLTIEELKQQQIALDILSVRKSGTGRMGCFNPQSDKYYDAPSGTVFFMNNSKSFSIVTHQPVNKNIGSVKPLKVIHEYGDAPLNILALQTYHLAQLNPASGYSASRLPWVLHLADKSSKEMQRMGSVSVLQNVDREKLISV